MKKKMMLVVFILLVLLLAIAPNIALACEGNLYGPEYQNGELHRIHEGPGSRFHDGDCNGKPCWLLPF